jgi:hypothetical protein
MAEPKEPQRPKKKASIPEALNEYGLEQDQEPEGPKKKASISGQPLPRLWKTEPEPDEELDENGAEPSLKKASKGDDKATSQATPKAKSASGKAGKSKKTTKASAQPGEKKEKKVLLEDTPSLDTYESRRRARLIMGALTVACVLLMVWITYRVFLYEPSTITVLAEDPMMMAGPPLFRPPSDVDKEARYTLNNAQEYAKNGRTDQAIGPAGAVGGGPGP